MGSLSNLYISQSYQSLIQLGSNTSASANLIQLQDGLGNNLGVALNTQGDISASGDINASTLRIELDTEITGAVDINTFFTASTPGYTNSTNPYFTDVVRVIGSYPSNNDYPTINDVRVGWICNGINVTNGIVTAVSGSGTGDVYVTIAGSLPQISQPYTFRGRFSVPTRITGSLHVSNDITASGNLYVSGTINSNTVITTTISSSQIYSSGSNIFGDSISDSQTIVGGTTISGSLTIDGQLIHRGNVDITGSLKVSNDISSSTVSGIGNVTAYSASVDSRLDYLEGPFSTSVDNRLDLIEFFTSSEETKNITLAAYTGSNDTKWNTLTNVTASILSFTSSQEAKDITLGAYTASLINAFTASGKDVTFNGNISVSGSINAYAIYTTIESSSVIYSSGSNVLGDASNDTQTLNGTVNVVNTLFVSGTEFTPFSQSVDLRLDQLEQFSSSFVSTFVTQTQLAAATGSLINSIATKLDTGSFNTYTASYSASVSESFATAFNAINQRLLTISFNVYTQSQDTKNSTLASYTSSLSSQVNNLIASTGSYAKTTIGNTFTGNNTFNGRVNGNSTSITVVNSTASLDCSLGNFFYLTLPSGSTFISASNIIQGQTISLKLQQPGVGYGIITYNTGSLKFPQGAAPILTNNVSAEDILTFVSYDSNVLYGVLTQNLI